MLRRFRKAEMDLPCISAEDARCKAGKAVLLLNGEGNSMKRRVSKGDSRGVSAGADDAAGMRIANYSSHSPPRGRGAAERESVQPWARPIQRMEIKQLVPEPGAGQHRTLDSTNSTDEKRIHFGGQPPHRASDGEAGVEMTTGPAAGEDDPHLHAAEGEGGISRSGADHLLPRASDIHEDAGHQQAEHEIRPAVRDERQRQTRSRQKPDGDADVQEGGDDQSTCNSNGGKLQERRSRIARNAEAEESEQRKGKNNPHKPNESPLLADRAGDEVIVWQWQESVLLAAVAETHSKKLT